MAAVDISPGKLELARTLGATHTYDARKPDCAQEILTELAGQVARMPADGIVIAKEAYRLVEQSMGMALSEVGIYLLHAYGTNLQFEPDEFNFRQAPVG